MSVGRSISLLSLALCCDLDGSLRPPDFILLKFVLTVTNLHNIRFACSKPKHQMLHG